MCICNQQQPMQCLSLASGCTVRGNHCSPPLSPLVYQSRAPCTSWLLSRVSASRRCVSEPRGCGWRRCSSPGGSMPAAAGKATPGGQVRAAPGGWRDPAPHNCMQLRQQQLLHPPPLPTPTSPALPSLCKRRGSPLGQLSIAGNAN